MQINRVKISNILGIDELDFQTGRFVRISGRNGSGKTSILEAIKAALEGGNDATIVRNGAGNGEVVLELTDGTTIKRKFNGKVQTEVLSPDGTPVAKPGNFIDRLADLFSVNPIQFLTADKKTRTNVLLETLDMKVSESDLRAACGQEAPEMIDLRGHALDVIGRVHKAVYEERTAINRTIKQNQAKVDELQATYLVEIDADTDIEARLDELEKAKNIRENKLLEYKSNFKGDYADASFEMQSWYQAEIKKLDDERAKRLNALAERRDKAIAEKQAAFDAGQAPLLEEIAKLREAVKTRAGMIKVREIADKTEAENGALEEKSQRQTEALQRLDALKLQLLDALPIKGLEVREGQVYYDGVHFDRVNTAKRIQLAVEIAKLRAGELGIICVDGIEALDPDSYKQFEESIIASGLQMFLTEVNDNELTIENV